MEGSVTFNLFDHHCHMKYVSVIEYEKRSGNDQICLRYLFEQKTKNEKHCKKCNKEFRFHPVNGRKCFECAYCGIQIYPMKDTIFEGSSTSLVLWFKVIYMFYTSRNGVSAKQIERVCGVTYKTAWRMGHKVRSLMSLQSQEMISGIIEMDESYFGGKKPLNKKGRRGIGEKQVVFGMLQRGGPARVIYVKNRDKETLLPLIKSNIERGSSIYSDGYGVYGHLASMGYNHEVIKHKRGHRFKAGIWTNGIESLWSYIKSPLLGTYRSVSNKYIQSYLDEFVFRYNMNKNGDWLEIILCRVSCPLPFCIKRFRHFFSKIYAIWMKPNFCEFI